MRLLKGFVAFAKASPRVVAVVLYVLIFLGVIMAAVVSELLSPPPPPLTPEQLAKRQQSEQVATLQRQRREKLCHAAAVCPRYAKTRQECATAGSFRTCIDVRMGKDAAIIGMCTDEGELRSEPEDMPDALSCFLFEKLGMEP